MPAQPFASHNDRTKENTLKQPMSRINSFKRNWDTPDIELPEEAEVIDWPPSPQQSQKDRLMKSHTQRALQASATRLMIMKEAMSSVDMDEGETVSPVPIPSAEPPAPAFVPKPVSMKRPSPTAVNHNEGPPAKKRIGPWEISGSRGPGDSRKIRDPFNPSPSSTISSLPSGISSLSSGSSSFSSGPSNAASTNSPLASSNLNIKQKVVLSAEQQQILLLVKGGQNVFFTGSAGTGKSVLLREIITAMRSTHAKSGDAVAVTASTGLAACNIGGITLHSFGGIGLGIESPEQLVKKIRHNRKATTRWQRTKVLIIDEVSMVDGDLFDKLATIAQILRKNSEPFGGIQLIVTGDFFQLPPVCKGTPKFAFDAVNWPVCIQRTFNLTKVFRQKDQEFIDMLNEMRFGKISPRTEARFQSLRRSVKYDDEIEPTELFPRREDVERANLTRLNALQGEPSTFSAFDGGSLTDMRQRETILGNFMAPSSLCLKVDSQVMLIKNIDETLVNGSMGKVLEFLDEGQYKKRTGGHGDTTSEILAGEEDQKGKKASTPKRYPLVKFSGPSGTREVLVTPESFKVELPNGEVPVSRSQLPLILAWAISIHKSQGQTLDRVKVDLGRVFEKGQAYVAISRATSLEGLQILGFEKKKVQAHPRVAEWCSKLECIS